MFFFTQTSFWVSAWTKQALEIAEQRRTGGRCCTTTRRQSKRSNSAASVRPELLQMKAEQPRRRFLTKTALLERQSQDLLGWWTSLAAGVSSVGTAYSWTSGPGVSSPSATIREPSGGKICRVTFGPGVRRVGNRALLPRRCSYKRAAMRRGREIKILKGSREISIRELQMFVSYSFVCVKKNFGLVLNFKANWN